jgi:hypothetical protein
MLLTLFLTIQAEAAPIQIRAVNLTSFGWDGFGGSFSDSMIRAMKADGANTVVFALTNDVDPNTNIINAENAEPNQNLAHAIAVAQSAGLQVGLKLEYLKSGNTLASASFNPRVPAIFFANYKSNVLAWAQYARAYGMSLLVIGTEMGGYLTGTQAYRPYWTDIVGSVRARFKGAVTYAAGAGALPARYYAMTTPNWSWEYDEASWVTFWPLLDYVGIDAYPVLAASGLQPLQGLSAALVAAPDTIDHTKNLFNWPAHWDAEIKAGGKPGLITELGAPSVAGALACPGCWPASNAAPDQLAQSQVYALMLGRMMSDTHVAGIMIHADNAYMDTHYATGFSFYGKLAESVVKSMWK